jgi:hypothetical protein
MRLIALSLLIQAVMSLSSSSEGTYEKDDDRKHGDIHPSREMRNAKHGKEGATSFEVLNESDGKEQDKFDWHQFASPYMSGNTSSNDSNNDWTKYLKSPSGENSSSFDWQEYAGPYMAQSSSTGGNSSGAKWNNGQGDGFGEPFRSQTGGDFRYKSGRDWNDSQTGGWQQFAAPYNSVNPQEPGSESTGNDTQGWSQYGGNQQGNFDWQKFASPYMGGSSGSTGQSSDFSSDWNKYAGSFMGVGPQQPPNNSASAGGYFELEVSGKNLNVTTNFGLGQGRGGIMSTNSSGGGGGGGGNQNTITADEGRIFLRGNFLNELGKVVPAY